MTALEEIKKPLEGKDIATLTNVELVTEISRLLSTIESAHAEENRLRAIALDMQAGYREAIARAEAAEAEMKRLRDLLRFSHDTLWEINPSNYDHDDVCKLNDASVEVILAIAPELGESALASIGGEHHAE